MTDNSEMILTNEVTIPVNHRESSDINEIYLEEVSKLTASIESSTQFDQTTNDEMNTTEANSDLNLSKIVSVICVWC